MNVTNKYRFLSSRNISIGLAFLLVALIAGVYFLFKPFPAGPSINVKAKVLNASEKQEAAPVNLWSYEHSNPPTSLGAIKAQEAVPVSHWNEYANPPSEVKAIKVQEAATVNRWYEYANPPEERGTTGIKLPRLTSPAGQKVFPGQGLSKGFMLGGTLFPENP